MSATSIDHVRQFLLERYGSALQEKGLSLNNVPDNFDLLQEGVIDSFGVLDLVTALEQHFGLELDMAGMETEQLTVLGPLARYVSEQVAARGPQSGAAPSVGRGEGLARG